MLQSELLVLTTCCKNNHVRNPKGLLLFNTTILKCGVKSRPLLNSLIYSLPWKTFILWHLAVLLSHFPIADQSQSQVRVNVGLCVLESYRNGGTPQPESLKLFNYAARSSDRVYCPPKMACLSFCMHFPATRELNLTVD